MCYNSIGSGLWINRFSKSKDSESGPKEADQDIPSLEFFQKCFLCDQTTMIQIKCYRCRVVKLTTFSS